MLMSCDCIDVPADIVGTFEVVESSWLYFTSTAAFWLLLIRLGSRTEDFGGLYVRRQPAVFSQVNVRRPSKIKIW